MKEKTAGFQMLDEGGPEDENYGRDNINEGLKRHRAVHGISRRAQLRAKHANDALLMRTLQCLDELAKIGASVDIKECARMSAGDLRQFAADAAEGRARVFDVDDLRTKLQPRFNASVRQAAAGKPLPKDPCKACGGTGRKRFAPKGTSCPKCGGTGSSSTKFTGYGVQGAAPDENVVLPRDISPGGKKHFFNERNVDDAGMNSRAVQCLDCGMIGERGRNGNCQFCNSSAVTDKIYIDEPNGGGHEITASGEDVARVWDSLDPKQRQKQFLFGNTLTTYRQWNELDEKEKARVVNADRVVKEQRGKREIRPRDLSEHIEGQEDPMIYKKDFIVPDSALGGRRAPRQGSTARRQPRSPEEVGSEEEGLHPFLCVKCNEPLTAQRIGFINQDGMIRHCDEVSPAEVRAAQDANNGHGYKLSEKVFPGWYEHSWFKGAKSVQASKLRWEETNDKGVVVTKEKPFTSDELRKGFEKKLREKDNFKRVVSSSDKTSGKVKMTAKFLQSAERQGKTAGSHSFGTMCEGKDAATAYRSARDQARAENGHQEGYSGDIQTTHGFVMIMPPKGIKPGAYAELIMDYQEGETPYKRKTIDLAKFPSLARDASRIQDRGPCGCIQMGANKFYFFGWAHS